MSVTGLILAGGRGTRMGDVDKGLQVFRGEPMVAHVIARLAPQVDTILINANRNPNEYAAFGHIVLPDAIDGFAGPLAGLHVGMTHARTEWIVTVPCDSPFLARDLVARLMSAASKANADLAFAQTFAQPHPVFCLARTALEPSLRAFLETGQRKIDKWFDKVRATAVSFDDQDAAFANINTVAELQALENAKPATP